MVYSDIVIPLYLFFLLYSQGPLLLSRAAKPGDKKNHILFTDLILLCKFIQSFSSNECLHKINTFSKFLQKFISYIITDVFKNVDVKSADRVK